VGWLASDLISCGLLKFATWKLVFQFLASVRLADILRAQGCHHLHIHFAHVPTQIGMYAAAMAGVPFTIMAHANDIFERGLLLEQKARRAVRLLTISEHNRAYLERIGVPADKLAVVRCGVSFASRPSEPHWTDREVYRIGTLGRLVEKKGVEVLIRAVAQLRERPYRIELSIAGDGPLRGDLEKLAVDLGLGETVRFEGSMPHDQVQSWMHGLDAFVLACKQDANGDMDGIPVVLMEAMSQAVPVISTRLSGIPELVMDGETGLLAAPGDPDELAEHIDRLLTAPDLRQQLAEHAVDHVRSEFGQQVNLDRLMAHLGLATR
jgi:glycosyltransferase involved in cell wall biosynthesis